jgi:hypothetical protein
LSQTVTNKFVLPSETDFEFFLVSSLPHANRLVKGSAVDASDISNSEAHSDNTDVETEADWIDEQHLMELAQKQPSKFEDSMRLEVCPRAIFPNPPHLLLLM